jgi:hypothetical protein
MLSRQIALVIGAFIILVVVFVFLESTFSSTFQQCIAAHEAGTANDHPSVFGITVDAYFRCTGSFVKSYEAAIGALGTIIIAAFTATLWIATSRQAELTREAFIADKRAFVFASGISPFYEPDPATSHFNWRIAPTWQNSGDTPTRALRIYTDCVFSNAPIPPTFDFNYVDPNSRPGMGNMLGPKMVSIGGQAPHLPHQTALTPQDILDIQNGRKFFYLWGWARYFDTLPGTREHSAESRRFCRGRCATKRDAVRAQVAAQMQRALVLLAPGLERTDGASRGPSRKTNAVLRTRFPESRKKLASAIQRKPRYCEVPSYVLR